MTDSRNEHVRSLSEEQLRSIVLIPLLSQMGFQDVIEYHGTVEKGKDIICRYRDMAGEMRYVGVVVKRNDIHGAVGRAGNAGEILLQVQQTFDQPYTDIFDLKAVLIDECWVVTSGLVKPSAIESISGTLKKSNLDKLVRFIDQRKLCTLIDHHLPGFWSSDRNLSLVLHEMRAPLCAARATALFLEESTDNDNRFDRDRVRKLAGDIVLHMVLIERMLESNYLFTTSDLPVQAREEDLNKVVGGVVHQMMPLSQRRYGEPRTLKFEGAPGTQSCEIDARLISQAVWNLVDNALRYGDPRRPVTVTIDNRSDSLDVVVTDFGLGVPPETADKIMQPYFRAENAIRTSPSGAGLGLTVAQRIAAAHEGALIIRSCRNPTVLALSLPKRRRK